MELYNELKAMVEALGDDMDKCYNRSNGTAGTRIRQDLQGIKAKIQELRADISRHSKEVKANRKADKS